MDSSCIHILPCSLWNLLPGRSGRKSRMKWSGLSPEILNIRSFCSLTNWTRLLDWECVKTTEILIAGICYMPRCLKWLSLKSSIEGDNADHNDWQAGYPLITHVHVKLIYHTTALLALFCSEPPLMSPWLDLQTCTSLILRPRHLSQRVCTCNSTSKPVIGNPRSALALEWEACRRGAQLA